LVRRDRPVRPAPLERLARPERWARSVSKVHRVPGVSPFYVAGWLNTDGSIRSGAGFTAGRFEATGSYQILVPLPPDRGLVIPSVSTYRPNTVARIVSFSRSALTGVPTIIVEVRTLDTNALVDGEVLFIVANRSS
jgi:hypothetical protein